MWYMLSFNQKKKHIGILLVCLIISLLEIELIDGNHLTKPVYGFVISNKYVSNPHVILDKSGIPLVNYSASIGLQRNPLTVANFAQHFYGEYVKSGNDTSKKLFLNNINWLSTDAVSYGNYSILQYKFSYPFYGLHSPWRSAMAQSAALPVLIRAYQITGNGDYLELAKKLTNSFFVDVKHGGITYKTPNNGWWYEEYAGNTNTSTTILSGMLYTVLKLHDYYNLTNDPLSKYVFDQGVLSLTKNLPLYDKNRVSYDDLQGHIASPDRLKFNLGYLEELYHLTRQQIFKFYHDRWLVK